MSTRSHFQEELEGLERSALGGLDLVVQTLDRALETVANQDVELAGIVIAVLRRDVRPCWMRPYWTISRKTAINCRPA